MNICFNLVWLFLSIAGLCFKTLQDLSRAKWLKNDFSGHFLINYGLLNSVISWLSQILFSCFDTLMDESRIRVYYILQICTCTTAESVCVSNANVEQINARSSIYSE